MLEILENRALETYSHNFSANSKQHSKATHQVDQHTHVLLGQPVEEISRIAGQNLIIMEG